MEENKNKFTGEAIDAFNMKRSAGTFYLAAIFVGYFLMNLLYVVIPQKTVASFVAQTAQQLIFVLAAVLFFYKNGGIKNGLRLNKFSPKYILYAVIAFCGLFFGVGYINVLITSLMQKSGLSVGGSVTMEGIGDYISYVVSLSVFPAIGEEFLFRSLLLYALYYTAENGDDIKASLIVALAFASYHKNAAQLIYQFAYGFTLSMLFIRSGSAIPGIIMHAMNNFLILTATYFCPALNLLNIYTFIFGIIAFGFSTFLLGKGRKKGKLDLDGISVYLYIGIAACIALGAINNLSGLL